MIITLQLMFTIAATGTLSSYLDTITCWKDEKYKDKECFCFMDHCLESVRYAYLQDGLPLPVPVTMKNDISVGEDDETERDTKEASDVADDINATVEDTSTTSTTTEMFSLYDLLEGSDIVVKKPILQPSQWGVSIDKFVSLCDCQTSLPEIVKMVVVLSNNIWNPLLDDQRSALFREAKHVVENEVGQLLNSTDVKVSKGRDRSLARNKVEVELTKFVSKKGFVGAHLDINMTESHYDNHISVENYFIGAVRLYNNYTGPGVFGNTFRWYKKNSYDVLSVTCTRDLPRDAAVAAEVAATEEEEDNLITKIV